MSGQMAVFKYGNIELANGKQLAHYMKIKLRKWDSLRLQL